MIVDSSAVIALLRDEPEAAAIAEALTLAEAAGGSLISAATYVETGVVVDTDRNPVESRRLDDLLRLAAIEIVDVTVSQARLARAAYRDFGRGSGHPARLNFGDCFAYALAKESARPLLFKGDNFTHTDVTPALRPA